MPFSLSEYVSSGEIVNTRKNSVHGFLAFRGCDRPVILQLTGNCDPELAGRHLRFEARSSFVEEEVAVTEKEMDELRLAWIQIGTPKVMTIDNVLLLPTVSDPESNISPPENAGKPVDTVPHLRLEWYSQNGHTIIHLIDPVIEFVDPDDEKPDGSDFNSDLELDDDELSGEIDDESAWDETEQDGTSRGSNPLDDEETWDEAGFEEGEEENDPFGLFPQDLEAQLDQSTASPTWNAELDEETQAQWKDWDEVLEGTKDVPLSSLFDPPLKLPPVDSLDDQQVATQLTQILARLALHNVAFHMCEHFTPRMAYKLLLETILPEESTHPELPRIGYTMNFDTSESCEECAADFERRDSERKANRNPDDPDDDGPDSDVPF